MVAPLAVAESSVSVLPGLASATSSHVQVQFDIFAPVPPMPRIADDPDGRLYQERVEKYSTTIANLRNSSRFAALVSAELQARGVPELFGMSFTLIRYNSTGNTVTSANSSSIIPIVMAFLAAGCCFAAMSMGLVKFRETICPCCKREASKVEPYRVEVKPKENEKDVLLDV